MATKFKEKIKKGKEECKKLQEEITDLNKRLREAESVDKQAYADMQGEIDALTQEKESLVSQLESVKKEQVSLIEHLEQSKNFSFQMDDHSMSNLKHNLSMFDNKMDTLNQERAKIVQCLTNAGINLDEADFESVLEKLQDLLQNYEEDKR